VAVLELEDVTVGHGRVSTLSHINMTVDAGEVVAVLGPNGAGKSTLLNSIGGFLPLMAGTIRFDGGVMGRMPGYKRARAGVSLVPEGRSVINALTVSENLKLVRNPVLDPLEVFPQLKPLLQRKAGLCSGGEQQMLALGRALAVGGQLLLVDELSLGLAPLLVEELLPIVRKAADERSMAVLLVEQQIEDALKLADRAYIVAQGKVQITGNGPDLLGRIREIEGAYFGESGPDGD
jgi:branched-chain amino acid transport system ATP-binding protein